MVGDRLYMDTARAQSVGCISLLVLTGEATWQEEAAMACWPNVVAPDVSAFGKLLEMARVEAIR